MDFNRIENYIDCWKSKINYKKYQGETNLKGITKIPILVS